MNDSLTAIVETMIERGYLACTDDLCWENWLTVEVPCDVWAKQSGTNALMYFFDFCNYNEIPCCNPISFFQTLVDDARYTKMPLENLQWLLQFVIGGNGFVFSSIFDQNGDALFPVLRPADLIDDLESGAFLKAAQIQAQLPSSTQYHMDQQWLESMVFAPALNLREQYECFEESWNILSKENHTQADVKSKPKNVYRLQMPTELYDAIFHEYAQYCKSQRDDRKTNSDIDALLNSVQCILKLHKLHVELLDILENPEDIVTLKAQWLEQFKEYLCTKGTMEKLRVATQLGQNKTAPLMGMSLYLELATTSNFSEYILKKHPLWSTDDQVSRKLTLEDRVSLRSYTKHPLFIWLKMVDQHLNRPEMEDIAPLYLTSQLINKENVNSPFRKKKQSSSLDFIAFRGNIATNDEPAREYQLSYRVLLKALIDVFKNAESEY